MTNAALSRTKPFLRMLAAFLCCLLPQSGSAASAKPTAVSLDYCADQFLLSMADRDQVMALTTDAVKNHSFYREKARGLPLFNATSEEILHKTPDVVIRYWGGFKILPFLARTNVKVATARYGTGPEILYQNMRLVGAALDQRARAENLIRDYQNRLEKVRRRSAAIRALDRKIRVAYITPGGITAGKDTFVNNVFRLAGLSPLTEELGLVGWQPLPLEALVQNPPDLIIGSFFDLDNLHVSNWSLSRHGRIRKMIDEIPTIMVPGRFLSCNGIFSVEAAEYIQRETEKLFLPVDASPPVKKIQKGPER